MPTLSVSILGLNRVSTSIGLALKRYTTKGGRYDFNVTGYDFNADHIKEAQKMGAIHQSRNNLAEAVAECDIVVMALSYEEVEAAYKTMKDDLRDGAVILDLSPLKVPSITWGKTYLTDENHVVGMTPILNSSYMHNPDNSVLQAEEDLFMDSSTIISPSASCIKEAVDLAFNFSHIIGSKPRFLDPHEHDSAMGQGEQLVRLLGLAAFYHVLRQPNWDDLKWYTNSAFGALTRTLFDYHPDALRDEFVQNKDVLARTLDDYINILQQLRTSLDAADTDAIEAVTVETAEHYEEWINNRYRDDWDTVAKKGEKSSATNLMARGLFGGAIADRLFGDSNDKK